MIAKAFLRWLASFPVWVLSWVVVPLALLTRSESDDHLPGWASWWDEPAYGINGDPYWRGPDHANGHEREFWWRWKFLIRNSLGGWSHTVVGFNYDRIRAVRYDGDPNTANRPIGHSGRLHITVTLDDGSERECLYVVKQWGSSGRCYRAYIGYKMKDVLDYYLQTGMIKRGDYAQDVFSVNPLMGFVP